jgi:hypothetical protein
VFDACHLLFYIGYVYSMDKLKFFNRDDNKYSDLFEDVLRDVIISDDQQKVVILYFYKYFNSKHV